MAVHKPVQKEVLESRQQEQVVVFMTDPKPNFVSLVKRGANQQPWRVVKSQKEDAVVRKVLQAIVVPDGTPEDKIKAAVGEEVRLDTSKSAGGYTNYEQISRDVCKADSFELIVLDATEGIQGIAAEVEEQDSENFVMKLFKPKAPKINAIELPNDVTKMDPVEVKKQVASQVYDEFYRMESAIMGLLSQEKGDAGDKLKAVQMVIDNFMAFCKEAFSVAKFDASDLEDFPLMSMQSIADVQKAGKKISQKRLAELKTVHAALAAFIQEIEGIDNQANDTPSDGESTDTTKGEVEDMTKEETQALFAEMLAPLTESVNALKTSVDKLAEETTALKAQADAHEERVAKMEKAIPVQIPSQETDDTAPPKTTEKTEKTEKDIFAGVFFKSE